MFLLASLGQTASQAEVAQEFQATTQIRLNATASISLALPESLSPGPKTMPEVIANYISPSGNLPSFNIIKLPGIFPLYGRGLNQMRTEVEDSYRKLGLLNLRQRRLPEKLNQSSTFETQIEYSIKGQNYLAIIMIININQEHLICTATLATADEGKFKSDLSLMQNMLRSIRVSDHSGELVTENKVNFGLQIGIALLVLLLLWLRFVRHESS